MDALTANAIREIERLTKQAVGQTTEIDGRTYSTVPLHDPRREEAEPKTLVMHTLQGLVDYVIGSIDSPYIDDRLPFLHVESAVTVTLQTGIFGEFNQRVPVAAALAVVPKLAFGTFRDSETFNIEVQALFYPNDDRARVLALVGNLATEAVQTVEDDGVTQRATMKTGIVRRQEADVPNPVLLRPYRTFREIDQPESEFILRLRGGSEKSLPSCGLWEADGGLWELRAIEDVKTWLRDHLDGALPVYG